VTKLGSRIAGIASKGSTVITLRLLDRSSPPGSGSGVAVGEAAGRGVSVGAGAAVGVDVGLGAAAAVAVDSAVAVGAGLLVAGAAGGAVVGVGDGACVGSAPGTARATSAVTGAVAVGALGVLGSAAGPPQAASDTTTGTRSISHEERTGLRRPLPALIDWSGSPSARLPFGSPLRAWDTHSILVERRPGLPTAGRAGDDAGAPATAASKARYKVRNLSKRKSAS
jgi:hypothetical protein